MPITQTAATYIGINNENEFYRHHYLSEVFRGDIKATLDGYRPPHTRLQNLARDYFATSDRLRRERRIGARIRYQREIFQRLVTLLDYPWQP